MPKKKESRELNARKLAEKQQHEIYFVSGL